MRESVLDASVLIKWWRAAGEDHVAEARELRAAFETGDLRVVVPPLLFVEVINAFGRRWRWEEEDLIALATNLERTGFDVEEPPLESLARWTARGLTAYDACYVAVAEVRGIDLVTDDDVILSVAPEIARPLAAAR